MEVGTQKESLGELQGNEEQKKTMRTTQKETPRQTETKQQRKILGAGQTKKSVFLGGDVAPQVFRWFFRWVVPVGGVVGPGGSVPVGGHVD